MKKRNFILQKKKGGFYKMTPKEILLATLNHEETPQVAWVPFAGVHAGQLIGCNAKEVLSNGDNLYNALMAVH